MSARWSPACGCALRVLSSLTTRTGPGVASGSPVNGDVGVGLGAGGGGVGLGVGLGLALGLTLSLGSGVAWVTEFWAAHPGRRRAATRGRATTGRVSTRPR